MTMRIQLGTTFRASTVALLGIALAAGCSEDSKDPGGDQGPLPASNHLVLAEVSDTRPGTSYRTAIRRPGGGVYFSGGHSGQGEFGALGSQGDAVWRKSSPASVGGIGTRPIQGSPHAIYATRVESSSGAHGETSVVLCDVDGVENLELTLPYPNPTAAGGVAFSASSAEWDVLLLVGSVLDSEATAFPLIVNLYARNSGPGSFFGPPTVFFDQPQTFYRCLKAGGSGFFVAGYRLDAEGDVERTVVADINRHSVPHTLEWSVELEPVTGLANGPIDEIFVTHNAVLVAGWTYVDGGTRLAGMLTSLSKTGQVNWSRVVDPGERSSYFTGGHLAGNRLYLTGVFQLDSSDGVDRTGLGWVHVVDVSDGSRIAEYTFGSTAYRTVLTDMVVGPSTSTAYGFEETMGPSDRTALFLELEIGTGALPTTGRAPAQRSRGPAASSISPLDDVPRRPW